VIETRGTAYVVLATVSDGDLSPGDGRETIDAMVDAGWYVASDVYAQVVRNSESFE